MSTFTNIVDLISDGQNVDQNTINTVLRQLDGNTRYVKELLETITKGEAVYAREKSVESAVVVGSAVYWNATSQRFERGLASAYVNDDGNLATADSAQIWGIVSHKHNSTNADILLSGYATIDISAAVTSEVTSGLYYLSSTEAGKLVKQTPPVTVSVLMSDANGGVYVNPRFFDAFTDHKHYKFSLVCLPSGEHAPPAVDERHEITSADDEIEGWLPADNAIFGGNAPEGAAFGYNLSVSTLNNAWPPLPIGSAYIEWDKGEDKDLMGSGVPLGADGLCVIDNFGIWWMSDCYGDVPWPRDYDSADPISSSSESLECPRTLQMRMTIYFSKVTAQTSGNIVTSLRVAEDSEGVIELVCAGTDDPAVTGDLELRFNQNLQVQGTTDTGSLAIKSLTGNVLSRGPVLSGLKSNSASIQVSGTSTLGGYSYGQVTITSLANILGAELPVQLVRLSGVSEEIYEDILGIGFAAGKDSSFRAKFVVPADLGSVTSVTLQIRFKFLAVSSGSLPNFTMSYRKVVRASPATTHTALPTSDTSLTISMAAAQTPNTIDAGEYLEIATANFTAAPGDIVHYTLTRSGDGGDGYAGEVHVIDQRPTIVAAS